VTPSKEDVDALCRALVDQAKLIEGGWVGYRWSVLPNDAPPIQVHETRLAFFAGAQHLFTSIMGILGPEAEPTEADLKRMNSILSELKHFISEFKRSHVNRRGTS
jgi:hypothetical protein